MKKESVQKKLEKDITQYIKEVRKIVKEIKSNSKPQKLLLQGKKIRKFQYLKMNLTDASGTEYRIEKDDWNFMLYQIFYQKIQPSNMYSEILKKITEEVSDFKKELLTYFTEKIIKLELNEQINGIYSIQNLVKSFFKEMNDEVLWHRFEFDITGIALQPKIIQISPKIFIKKTSKKDVEEPIEEKDFIRHEYSGHTALAQLHVEYQEKKDHIDDHKIERILSILRLYKICDVEYNSIKKFHEGTQLFANYNEKRTYRQGHFIFGCMLTKKDIPRLKKFWKGIEEYIPKSFAVMYTQHGFEAIAFERYREAMTNPGIEEMRIAYAISGLEALFSVNETELNYRLRMRVSRILSLLGLSSSEIYNDVGVAYTARSAFDHGNRLASKDIIKIRNKYNFKDERGLTMIILDYLRISIIVVLISKQKKDDLINLIDKSWVSNKDQKKLEEILKPAKKLLDLKNYKPKYSIAPFNNADFSYIK